MFIRRIGVFFVLVGGLILFISVAAGKPNSNTLTLFCIGLPLSLLGGTLWYRNRDKTPAQRFQILRKFSTKKEKEEE